MLVRFFYLIWVVCVTRTNKGRQVKQNYSTLDIVKALEIPRERFREWLTRGYVKPQKPARGHGRPAVFTIEDVWMVALFRNLIESGYKRDVAGAFLDKIYYSAKSGIETARMTNIFIVRQAKDPKSGEIIVQATGSRGRTDFISIGCVQGNIAAIQIKVVKKPTKPGGM